MAAEQPVHAARRLVWCAAASRLRRLHMLSKLAYLMLCRSIQLLVVLARGDACGCQLFGPRALLRCPDPGRAEAVASSGDQITRPVRRPTGVRSTPWKTSRAVGLRWSTGSSSSTADPSPSWSTSSSGVDNTGRGATEPLGPGHRP